MSKTIVKPTLSLGNHIYLYRCCAMRLGAASKRL